MRNKIIYSFSMKGADDRLKLMIVDNDPLICELMQFNLEEKGFAVETFRDIKSAYNADLSDYSMFIIDAMMEDKRGMDLAKYLKQNSSTCRIPLIFCSAHDDENAIIDGLDLGADDYVLKPFAMKAIIARIGAILRRHGLKAS